MLLLGCFSAIVQSQKLYENIYRPHGNIKLVNKNIQRTMDQSSQQ